MKRSVGRLVFRSSISMIRVTFGRSGHLEATWEVLRQKQQNGALSMELRAAEETVEGDDDWLALWTAMNGACGGEGLPNEEGVVF